MKLYTLYFPPKEAFEPKADPNNPRRRRRKSKLQIFKEAYLPAILACLSLVLVLAFIVGAIGNAFARKEKKDQLAQQDEEFVPEEEPDISEDDFNAIMDMLVDDDGVIVE